MTDLLKAVVLGIIQGLTEFLPISSSAHLRIFPELFGWGPTITATVVSFVVGYAAIAWLLRYVSTRSYTPFVIYRIALGTLTLALVATGVLAA